MKCGIGTRNCKRDNSFSLMCWCRWRQSKRHKRDIILLYIGHVYWTNVSCDIVMCHVRSISVIQFYLSRLSHCNGDMSNKNCLTNVFISNISFISVKNSIIHIFMHYYLYYCFYYYYGLLVKLYNIVYDLYKKFNLLRIIT